MRKIPLILGLTLLAVLTAWETYDFFVNDGIAYFTTQPQRLLYILGISVAGGVLAWAFSRLSPLAHRTLRLIALGGFAACVTVFLCIFIARLGPIASMVTDSGTWGWVVAALVSLSIIAVLLWLEFYFAWRRSADRGLTMREGCTKKAVNQVGGKSSER